MKLPWIKTRKLTREEVLEAALRQAMAERDEAVEALHRLANEMLMARLGVGTTHHAPCVVGPAIQNL